MRVEIKSEKFRGGNMGIADIFRGRHREQWAVKGHACKGGLETPNV